MNKFSQDIFGLVLAGGRSSRMGTDKALLRTSDGQTWLDRQVRVLTQAMAPFGANDVFVSGNYPGAHVIADVVSGLGPLGGIYSAARVFNKLCTVGDFGMLILPVDMPGIGVGLLKSLLQNWRQDDRCLFFDGYWFPLLLRVDDAMLAILESRCGINIPDGIDRSIQGLVKKTSHRSLDSTIFPRIWLKNFNNPADCGSAGDEKMLV